MGALNIELRDTGWPRIVDAKLLNAEEIVTTRKVRRDGVGICLEEIPDCCATGEIGPYVENLEPYLSGTVKVYGCSWGFGHVY